MAERGLREASPPYLELPPIGRRTGIVHDPKAALVTQRKTTASISTSLSLSPLSLYLSIYLRLAQACAHLEGYLVVPRLPRLYLVLPSLSLSLILLSLSLSLSRTPGRLSRCPTPPSAAAAPPRCPTARSPRPPGPRAPPANQTRPDSSPTRAGPQITHPCCND